MIMLFIVGFPLGCLFGVLGAEFIFGNFSHLFLSSEITMIDFTISWKAIFFGFVLLIFLFIAIAWKSTVIINKQNSIETLKTTNRFIKNRKSYAGKRERLLNCISHRYMTLKIRIFLGILISLSLGGTLFCSADYLIQQSKAENEMTMKADDGLNSDYSVYIETSSFDQGISQQIVDQLKNIKGISSIYPVKNFLGRNVPTERETCKRTLF